MVDTRFFPTADQLERWARERAERAEHRIRTELSPVAVIDTDWDTGIHVYDHDGALRIAQEEDCKLGGYPYPDDSWVLCLPENVIPCTIYPQGTGHIFSLPTIVVQRIRIG